MTKKAGCLITAERMYVIELHTLKEIASTCRVSERTLIEWKKQGNWDKKRDETVAVETAFHVRLMKFAAAIMDKIEIDLKNEDMEVATGRLYSLNSILEKLPKTKLFDESIAAEKKTVISEELPPHIANDPVVRTAYRTLAKRFAELGYNQGESN